MITGPRAHDTSGRSPVRVETRSRRVPSQSM
jgi:hypothetical protein